MPTRHAAADLARVARGESTRAVTECHAQLITAVSWALMQTLRSCSPPFVTLPTQELCPRFEKNPGGSHTSTLEAFLQDLQEKKLHSPC